MSDEHSEADGAWIFVSHSNLDLKKVRQVRDALEKGGHKPILFFLKCLEKGDERLPQLIKDEIKARTWFVLCESDHARASPYVQEEVDIVKSTKPTESFVVIDLAKDLDVNQDGNPLFVSKLRPLLKRATVFFSYSRGDLVIARQIYDALIEQDYRAFLDVASMTAGMDWRAVIRAAFDDAVERGFVLLLLSPEYLTSRHCEEERQWALKHLGSRPVSNIVPIIVRDPDTVYMRLPTDLRDLQCIDITRGSLAQNITRLLDHLKQRQMT